MNPYSKRIIEQIFEADNAFFLDTGIDTDQIQHIATSGTYGGIIMTTTTANTEIIMVVLEVSDLYTVTGTYKYPPHVISIGTKKPISQSAQKHEIKCERVFAFDLMEVLWALAYRGGSL